MLRKVLLLSAAVTTIYASVYASEDAFDRDPTETRQVATRQLADTLGNYDALARHVENVRKDHQTLLERINILDGQLEAANNKLEAEKNKNTVLNSEYCALSDEAGTNAAKHLERINILEGQLEAEKNKNAENASKLESLFETFSGLMKEFSLPTKR